MRKGDEGEEEEEDGKEEDDKHEEEPLEDLDNGHGTWWASYHVAGEASLRRLHGRRRSKHGVGLATTSLPVDDHRAVRAVEELPRRREAGRGEDVRLRRSGGKDMVEAEGTEAGAGAHGER